MNDGPEPIDTDATGSDDFDENDLDGDLDLNDEPIRSHNWLFPVIALLVVIGFSIATYLVLRGPVLDAAVGPEGVPIQDVPDLASRNSTVEGTPVNDIPCQSTMGQGVDYHVHQRVSIFVNGEQHRIPAGVGISGPVWTQEIDGYPFLNNSAEGCVYWLHTHANDGILHVEAPSEHTATLGDFFDIWNQPLSADQVGPAEGRVVAYLDGERFDDPRTIPLTDDGVIQLNVGEPEVPFKPMEFNVKNVCGDGTLSCSPGDLDS